MSNEAVWLIVSFAVMVVAVLATLYEKLEDLQARVKQLEGGEEEEDDEFLSAEPARARFTSPRAPRRREDRER